MRLLPSLFALFLAVPLLEVYLLIEVGQAIGAPLTIAAVVGTALLGAALVRYQGMVTVTRFYAQLARGELPGFTLFEGACLLVAGALLLTPGFFTDAVGFALLTPPFRSWAYTRLRHRLNIRMWASGPGPGDERRDPHHQDGGDRRGPTTIEGEYRDHDRKREKNR
ncbi:FxsA family protein [Thiohalorhabdus methylotrophus]|uniref:FxsA family protein n=1 Tax=Thiohalorhabdus methylotrophus TaxID=3242694 RepID=A0ABV4TTZ4_9GAMM